MCFFFFVESSKVVTEWAQFLVKITRMYIFICDNCSSHMVKVANHLLQDGACACLFSSLGVSSSVCVCVCVRACTSVCACAHVHTHTSLFSHPASSPVVVFCFIFLLLLPVQETNTGSLCPPLDLPSFLGDQVGGKMLCRNVRPSPGSPASVSSHYWTEVAFCFFPSVTTTQSSLLSSCHFSRNPRGTGTEAACLGTLCCLITQPCVAKLCRLTQHVAARNLFSQVLMEGFGWSWWGCSCWSPCMQACGCGAWLPCMWDRGCLAPRPWAVWAQGPLRRRAQLWRAYICPWQHIYELRLPSWISG